ncbi:RadC family protein [Mucilaginibacter myungsuensis]|uniref:DNA repair protein RadC n=1 Tax=Mucilaginibacter myungsuensis TaxID=649104 RepID=A0A929L0W0_9SPHI|nr:DNA repair protein RadC [Mucilaginibacter myungsuensis]MBE9664187.1 DNA repair protein RadC [Mucilaginibacter myungsuensis]MDN3599890.1 DNA repair protein RadC [Mucilaginibacter myungsuensis]
METYENNLSIKAWAEEDRPREKLSTQGRRSLSDAELIAILIGSGSRNETAVELSKRILHHYDNDLNRLGKASIAELSKFKGIGEAKAISIIAALELGRRRGETETKVPDKIDGSRSAYNILRRHLVDLPHEEFWLLLLSRSNKLIAKELISKGGLSGTIADPKIIFHIALQHQASSVILAHNHPSNNKKPSQEDIFLTKKLHSAGLILDIKVVDHLIITDDGYLSFADEGLL